MKFFLCAMVFIFFTIFISLVFHRQGKCSIWMVILSPLIGLFIFVILTTCLILMSGDM